MQHNDDTQGQLWKAGPVRIVAKSHKRGAAPVIALCAKPGCSKMRRLVQGGRYCDEHATSVDYNTRGRGFVETRMCSCGKQFKVARARSDAPAALAWHELCPECRGRTPLTLSRLCAHSVPYDTAKRWLELRDDLRCERPGCGKRFTDTIRPQIDHDHSHCRGRTSCGGCIRGVICQVCNNGLGQVETLLRSCSYDELARFLQNRCN